MGSSAAASLHLTSGRLLARNTVWNLLGYLLHIAAGVVAVPPLVRALGLGRFGILSLVWIVIGYVSLFDLGIGRALTKLVADKLGANEHDSIAPLVWTSLLLMLLLGIAGSVMTLAAAPWLIRALKVPPELRADTLHSFYWLSLSIPLVTVTSGLRGVLEAQQRFRILTLIRIPMSLFTFLGPLLVLPFSHQLVPVVLALIGGRIIGCWAHLQASFHAMPELRHVSFDRSVIGQVFSFGGWMTVTNLISPLIFYVDRFIVGALLSVTMVAYYTAPFDVMFRLSIIPVSVVGVLFPAFAVSLAQDRERASLLINRGIKYILLAILPIVLIIFVLAPEGLRIWLGPVFAQNGTSVMRWLAVGIFFNAIAYVPFILIQSAGRPEITAKAHFVELPLYSFAVWLLTGKMGIQGTAITWTARSALDALILFICAGRLLPYRPRFFIRLFGTMVATVGVMGLALVPESLPAKVVFLSLALPTFGFAAWRWALGPGERAYLSSLRSQTPV